VQVKTSSAGLSVSVAIGHASAPPIEHGARGGDDQVQRPD
jgi:hypothetical protein